MALGKSMFPWRSLTFAHWFCTNLLIFLEVAMLQNEFAHFGPTHFASKNRAPIWSHSPFRLSRTFRGPFANRSRIFCPRKVLSKIYIYAFFLVCVSGCHCQFIDMGVRNWNLFISIDKQKHMSTSLCTKICQRVVFMQYTTPSKDPVAILQGNCRAWKLLL